MYNNEYGSRLLNIDHYNIHPEMIPFVGSKYNDKKILLLGESHYLEEIDSTKIECTEDWYKNPIEKYNFVYPENVCARLVVERYMDGYKSRAYSMFRNPAKETVIMWNLDESVFEAFDRFAFMNYFQRPSLHRGKSINVKDSKDEEYAYDTLIKTMEILKPDYVFFLSKKAYWSYKKYYANDNDYIIDYFCHPTCRHWYRHKDGRQKFRNVIGKI